MATEVSYNGNGSNKTFSITFPFIKSDDVKVQVGTETLSSSAYSITGTVVTTDTAPGAGTGNVKLYRSTPIDYPVHDYSAGSTIRAKNLNDNQKQVLYGIEEAKLVTVTSGGITTGAKNDIHVNSDTDWYIRTDAVEQSMLADNSVDSEQYVDGSIDRVHLAADIVDGTKIADDSINSEHYVADSIDAEHYAPGSVDSTAIGNNQVDSQHYATASIDNAHLADDAVGIAELSATGTASGTTFLRGDNSWASVPSTSPLLKFAYASTSTEKNFSSATWEDSGLSISYTPASSSSIILLEARPILYLRPNEHNNGSAEVRFELNDAGSALDNMVYGIHSGSSHNDTYGYSSSQFNIPILFTHIYSNSNTNAKTFKLQCYENSNAILTINEAESGIGTGTAKSYFTITEYST